MPSGPSSPYELDESISILRASGLVFSSPGPKAPGELIV